MHRSRLSISSPVHCCVLYMWPVRHYVLCYFSPRPGSISPSLREAPYLITVRVFLTLPQSRGSLVSASSPLTATAARPLPGLLPFAVDCKSSLRNPPFLSPSSPYCLSFLYRLYSFVLFSSKTQPITPFLLHLFLLAYVSLNREKLKKRLSKSFLVRYV